VFSIKLKFTSNSQQVCRDVELDETFVRRNSMLRETATTFGLNLDDPLPPQQLDEGGNGTGGTGPSISQKLNLSAEARKLLLLFDGAASASGGGSGGQLIRPAPQRPSSKCASRKKYYRK
jgi:hypothetical protein